MMGDPRLHARTLTAVGSLLIAVAMWLPCAHGASGDFEQRLETAIDQAQRELDAERRRIDNEGQARQRQLDDIRATCQELSAELVDRRLSIARKQQELAKLRRDRETLWSERVEWQEELAEIELVCEDMAKELGELADTLPVSEFREAQKQQLSKLRKMPITEQPEEAVSMAVTLVESFLREIRTTGVYEADVRDPQGREQRASVLRVGQNLFAYHAPSASATAIALSAPYEEKGFRWYERLPERMEQAVVAAVERASAPKDLYWLPVDVTGGMAATTTLSSQSPWDRLRSGGVVMIPLAFVAVCLTGLIADRLIVLLRESRHSLQFCDHVLGLCGRGDFEQAERVAARTKGVLSRTLKVCLAHRHSSPAVFDDAIQETFLHEFPKLERFLPSIRMLSSVAPMLGLLGTVTGIIATFDVITVVGSGRPQLMAGGISEALVTTATGLAIAIPGLLAHSVLSGKVDGMIAEAERFAATLSNLIKQERSSSSNGRDKRADANGATD